MEARPHITAELVRRLIATQFPQYADLPVSKVEPGGHDNRTFRVGSELSARLPSAEGYVAAVAKEQAWLPRLAVQLPVPIPAPVALGQPADEYPWPWSINRWLPGSDAMNAPDLDASEFARDLGRFLVALQAVDATGGPRAGAHSFFRGGSLATYDDETRAALLACRPLLSASAFAAATRIWRDAIASEWQHAPRWFHGDIAAGNLLVDRGRLSGVIDFGTCGVGDPACDLVITWTFFAPADRSMFADAIDLDPQTWARGRGWALWKALITVNGDAQQRDALRVIGEVVSDPVVDPT